MSPLLRYVPFKSSQTFMEARCFLRDCLSNHQAGFVKQPLQLLVALSTSSLSCNIDLKSLPSLDARVTQSWKDGRRGVRHKEARLIHPLTQVPLQADFVHASLDRLPVGSHWKR